MRVAFVPSNQDGNGHHFFSASKDRLIKYWDGDKFEQIQKLDGHSGEIWALAISRTGDFFVTASHDKSIRIWSQTDEQIFLEEEREKELEELYEGTLTNSLEQEDANGEEKDEVGAAGKQTVVTLMAGEKIAEALELGMADLEIMREYATNKITNPSLAAPARHPLFLANGNISAEAHVLATLQKIPAASLQDALLVLPFAAVPSLFTFLDLFAQQGQNIPLTCRVLAFMLKVHHKQIVASKTMRPMLDAVRVHLRAALRMQKDMVGYNLAALKVISMRIKEGVEKDFFIDGEELEGRLDALGIDGKGVKKRAFVDVA
jgi:U3 small nucleolar RNA-associated protein 12